MLAWLTLGFMIGLQHALEADHVAAVGALVSGKTDIRRVARLGAVWGLGHTLTLALFGGAVFALKLTVDESLGSLLELVVGLMLVLLGVRLLARLLRDRVHFHLHRHRNKTAHLHAHSHRGDVADHAESDHAHTHHRVDVRRTFLVGIMHGFAGSAAIVALTASSGPSAGLGLVFIIIFGLGSLAGMAALSAVIAIPLSATAKSLTWANRLLQVSAGTAATGIGLLVIYQNGTALAAFG